MAFFPLVMIILNLFPKGAMQEASTRFKSFTSPIAPLPNEHTSIVNMLCSFALSWRKCSL